MTDLRNAVQKRAAEVAKPRPRTMGIDKIRDLWSRDYPGQRVGDVEALPLKDPEKYESLREDIRANGIQTPLLVTGEESRLARLYRMAMEHVSISVEDGLLKDHSNVWYHGSPDAPGATERPEEAEGETPPHWNTRLGQHWTSVHQVASEFARGKSGEPGSGTVTAAHLAVAKPRKYGSEYAMDEEAFNDAWDKHSPHDPMGKAKGGFHALFCPHPEGHGMEAHAAPDDPVNQRVKSSYGGYTKGGSGLMGQWISTHPESAQIAAEHKAKLVAKGYDGITYGNEIEGPKRHKCAITFDHSQVHEVDDPHTQTIKESRLARLFRMALEQQEMFPEADSEHLTNPVDGSKDWHHGSPHTFKSFDEDREDDDGDYDEAPEQPHWNTHLGQHWTSVKQVARNFAKGKYANYGEPDSKGTVFTAHLGIKNPKHYESEFDMDHEAIKDAWDKNDAHDPHDVHSKVCHDDDYGLEDHESGDAVDRAVRDHYTSRTGHRAAEWLSSHPHSDDIAYSFKQKLQQQGHDGVTYGNEGETPIGHRCAITFDNGQIHNLRSETGTTAKLAARPQKFFHGSSYDFEPGQVLTPGHQGGSHVYFAGNKTEPTSGNYGHHLYEVEPLGEYESDPALAHIPELASFRTKYPVRVVRKLAKLSASDHDVLYHLTDQHHFSLDPEKAPSDNTFALQDRSGNKGLYVTDNPDRWRANGYHRPYVAEIHVPHGLARDERWGGEKFIPAEHFDKVKVNRVIPFDAHQREKYGEPGTVEDYHGTHYETDEPLEKGSGWGRVRVSQEPEAKDVRTITPEEHSRHLLRLREYLHGAKGYGWNEFNDKHEHVGVDEDDSDDEGMPIRRDKSGKPMTMERSATLHTAMNAEDEVPPEMGTAPIPEGHVRLYHHTWASSVPSIREHGLLASMGRGDGGKGPSEPSAGVWASTRHDPPPAEGDRHVVEFHVHPDEIDVNGPNHGRDPKEWNAGDHNVLLKGSVKPENFVAIHSPWHTAYHQMSEPRMRDETLKGQYDNIGEDPQYAHSYGRAITKIKAEGMLHVAAAPTFGPEHYDLWKQPQPEWDPNKEWDDNYAAKHQWTHSMRRALSLGHLNHKDAVSRGYHAGGHDNDDDGRTDRAGNHKGWQPMPHDLYHVTTNAPAVREHGLKTRDELDQASGAGLGGGESDTISFTTDPKMADAVHHGLHEMRQVARGERTIPQMLDEARRGVGADHPFHEPVIRYYHNGWREGDPLPMGLDSAVRGKHLESSTLGGGDYDKDPAWSPHPRANTWLGKDGQTRATHWERDATDDEKVDDAVHFHKSFATFRQHAGGIADPMFFSSDAKGLANVPEHHIQVMRFHPKPGAQGYPVSGMKEWRTASGDAVEPHHEDTTSGGSLAVKREVSMKLAKVASPNDAIHLGTLHYLAHDSGDGATCYHCPFCGSGNIVGRSDGTIECSYCLNHFTVQTQPEFASMPQTIDGQPQQMPGMPGDPTAPLQEPQEAADADSAQPGPMGDPGAQEPAADPSEEPPAGGGGGKPPWLSKLHTAGPSADAYTPTQDTGDVYCRECGGVGQTQEGKSLQDCSSCGGTGFSPAHRRQLSQDLSGQAKRYYVTASGVALDEDAYTRHLALSFADDHPEVLAQVRRINAAKASV